MKRKNIAFVVSLRSEYRLWLVTERVPLGPLLRVKRYYGSREFHRNDTAFFFEQ